MDTCEATTTVPTMEGDREIRCTLEPPHEEHYGKSGPWPVRWTDEQRVGGN